MHELQSIDPKSKKMNNTNTFNSADFAQFLLKTQIARQGERKIHGYLGEEIFPIS